MADSKIPSIEPAPVSVTEQQLQPHTNYIVEEQQHVMTENVTLEVKAKEHTVEITAIGIEKASDEQSEYIAVKGVKAVAQRQEVEIITKTETSEGETIEHLFLIRLMVGVAIFEMEHTKYPHMIEGVTPVYSPSLFEKCLDCCCTAYSCKWLCYPFKKHQQNQQDKKEEDKDLIPKTESIRRALILGVKEIVVGSINIFSITAFGSTVREVAVYGGFLCTLLFFSISLWGLIKDHIEEKDLDDDFFRLFKTLFGAIGMVFSMFDLFYHAYHRRFKTCKEWKEWRQWREEKKNNQENIHLLRELPDNQEKENAKQPDSANCCKDQCKCLPEPCAIAFDVARVFVMEMLYYPALILSVFQFATELVINDNDPSMISITTWLSNIISFVGQLTFVYLARAFVLAGTVYTVAKIREKKKFLEGATFQITFVLYTYGLMILQICMIVAIGATYYNEYYKLYQEVNSLPSNHHNELYQEVNSFYISSGSGSSGDNPTITPTNTPTIIPTNTLVTEIHYRLSDELWFMICCAFMTPVLGVIMFFVVHHFWTQKFTIEVILDFLKVLKKKSITAGLKSEECRKIINYLGDEQLQEDFNRIPRGRFSDKFTYPFKSPLHIILCLLYSIMLLFSSAALSKDQGEAGFFSIVLLLYLDL